MGETGPVFRDPGLGEADCTCAVEGGADCVHICEEVCPTGAIVCEFIIVAAEATAGTSEGCPSCGGLGGSDCSAS